MKKFVAMIGKIGLLGFAGIVGATVGFGAVVLFVKFVIGSTPMMNDVLMGAYVGAASLALITLIFPKPMEKLLEVVSIFS